MASHKMKRQRGRYRRDSGEDETREKEGARNQSDKRGTDREAGLLQGRGQSECKNQSVAQKKNKNVQNIKLLFMYQTVRV